MEFEIRKLIDKRRTDPGAYYYPDPWWEKEIDIIVKEVDAAMKFISSDCSDEELYWLAEVLDDVIGKTKNAAFLECFRERAEHVENPEWKQSILDDIKTATDYL